MQAVCARHGEGSEDRLLAPIRPRKHRRPAARRAAAVVLMVTTCTRNPVTGSVGNRTAQRINQGLGVRHHGPGRCSGR